MSTKQSESGGYNMTPEQRENLKRFGKKNGVPEQKVQAQLESVKVETQPVSTTTVQKTILQPNLKPVASKLVATKPPLQVTPSLTVLQQAPQVIDTPSNNQIEEYPCETYFCFEDVDAGNLEIDLITFREKGVETRYLSLLFSGLDVRQNPPIQQEAYLNIESKEEFERIKAFFAQLEWEK